MEVLELCRQVPDFGHPDIAIVVKIIHIEIDLSVLFTDIISLVMHDSLEFFKADATTAVSIPVFDIKLSLAQTGYFNRELCHAELRVSDSAITIAIKGRVVSHSHIEPFGSLVG